MDGNTVSFFELAALPAIGETLLDPRPAFVFAADGSRVLFANAAAIAVLDEDSLAALLARRFTDLNPFKAQMARLSRLLPSETARLEVLRFGGGVNSTTITAACRRLNFADDRRAVFALGMGSDRAAPFLASAEHLTAALAGRDGLAVLLDADAGKIAAEEHLPAVSSADVHRLAAAATASPQRNFSEDLRWSGDVIRAGAVKFHGAGRDLVLVVAHAASDLGAEGPAPAFEAAPAGEGSAPMAVAPPLVDGVVEPSAPAAAAPLEVPHAPTVRFTFELDRVGQFLSVTPELAEAVGPDNGRLAGHAWAEIAAGFGPSADAVSRALAQGAGFSARLPWPALANAGVEVELTALPDPRTGHYHGFGIVGGSAEALVTSLHLDAPAAPVPAPPADLSEASRAVATPPSALTDDVDQAAQKSIEKRSDFAAAGADKEPASDEPAALAPAPAAPAPAVPPASNIVRLPGTQIVRAPAELLSGNEREAFRRIAEALGRRTSDDTAADVSPADAAPASSAPVPSAPDAPHSEAAADGVDPRVLDRLPVGVVIFRDKRTLFANRTLIDLLGYESRDAFLAAGGADVVFPGPDGIGGSIAAAEGNVLARRSDGTSIQVKAWLHAVPYAGATALMLSLVDIDRDQSLAAALTQSDARVEELETILDTATDGVIVFDRRGRTESMNHAAEALFGVDASEYFGRYFTDLLADESQKAALDYLDGLHSNGVASVLNDGREVIGRTPAGGLIPLFMTIGRIGTSEKFCAVLRDITHWKNVEEELVASRRSAEAANTQKSDFLAKISHEIRTPLNAIIGFSEVMASERFGPVGNERYREYLRDIHVSGSHLMSLINDLLDLSKIEAGKVDLSFEAVPVNAAIRECVALMQPQANRERIIIRTALGADVPSVVADPRSLRQILLNLLSNAIKFTRAGGQVIVSSSLEGTGELVVRIRDTGIGMSDKDMETALKPFRQVAPATEGREQGTGLGLPLTKALVEANRATLTIDSAPNQGTVAKITFPTTRVLAS